MSTLRITRRAADRLRSGYLWVYRTDLDPAQPELAAGTLATVTDLRNQPLGTALYSSASKIVARLVSPNPGLSREQYLDDIRTRIKAALQLRCELTSVTSESNAYRMLFSEADNLPGIIADRYNDLVVLQLLTQGTAQEDVRQTVVDEIRAGHASNGEPLTIWERPDPRIRELEQLEAPAPGPLFSSVASPGKTTIFTLNNLRFGYDAAAGQKTGAFLDQRLNYAAAVNHVRAGGRTRRALDICTYQGGFALHLAQVCERVTGIDSSRTSLEAADRNLALNPQLKAETDWVEADAFALMNAYDAQREKFDVIVLDPPAFAKSKRAAQGAMRGYKELNLRAMRMLTSGGILISNSCSHYVPLDDFTALVASAAADAGRRVQLLEIRTATADHPEILTLPETRYLKCLICRAG